MCGPEANTHPRECGAGGQLTNAVILAAGQGRRLSPLTDTRPKCLVEIAGRPLLDWQLRALAQAGVREATVVTGFAAASVEAALSIIAPSMRVTCLHNPFHAVADNIASAWMARDLFGPDTLLINGDTIFDPRVAVRALAGARAPLSVTIDRKPSYDADDMKVRIGPDGALARIGKTLEGDVDGESIGMIRLRDDGGARFTAALEAALRDPQALSRWYLSVIDALAEEGGVGVVSIEGLPWAEVDFPRDLAIAAERAAAFQFAVEADAAAAGRRRTAG